MIFVCLPAYASLCVFPAKPKDECLYFLFNSITFITIVRYIYLLLYCKTLNKSNLSTNQYLLSFLGSVSINVYTHKRMDTVLDISRASSSSYRVRKTFNISCFSNEPTYVPAVRRNVQRTFVCVGLQKEK